MKRKLALILLTSVLLIVVSVAAVIMYIDRTTETKFTMVTGTIHEYFKKVKEVKLEDLGTNLALKMEADTNAFTQDKKSETATDGDVTSYWEGAPDSYPNTLTVDLRSVKSIKAIRVKLNPDTIWEKRTQTFSILGSTDSKAFTEIVPSAKYIFDPEENASIVTIKFIEIKVQYIRLNFIANTAATAGQAAEFEVY